MDPIFLVVGDTARNPGRSGIQTLVRCLAAAFGANRAPVRPVIWNARRRELRPLPPALTLGPAVDPLRDPPDRWPPDLLSQPSTWPFWFWNLGQGHKVALHHHPRHRRQPRGTWVLMPELMYKDRARQLIDYVHARGWRIAFLLYDLIPVLHPEFVPPGLTEQHDVYLRAISRADLLLPISDQTARDWEAFAARENLPRPPVVPCSLACDLSGVPRVREIAAKPGFSSARLLCVSTLEPRKNHRTLLAAFEIALQTNPGLSLDLVGASYTGSGDLTAAVNAATDRLPGLRWHGQIEYDALLAIYAKSDFTVYPSLVEGFGLPVIESLWLGRPCLCSDQGVMAESAAAGGCLTVDVRDPQALANAMLRLAGDPDLRRRLALEAIQRPLKTWSDYADELLALLAA